LCVFALVTSAETLLQRHDWLSLVPHFAHSADPLLLKVTDAAADRHVRRHNHYWPYFPKSAHLAAALSADLGYFASRD